MTTPNDNDAAHHCHLFVEGSQLAGVRVRVTGTKGGDREDREEGKRAHPLHRKRGDNKIDRRGLRIINKGQHVRNSRSSRLLLSGCCAVTVGPYRSGATVLHRGAKTGDHANFNKVL